MAQQGQSSYTLSRSHFFAHTSSHTLLCAHFLTSARCERRGSVHEEVCVRKCAWRNVREKVCKKKWTYAQSRIALGERRNKTYCSEACSAEVSKFVSGLFNLSGINTRHVCTADFSPLTTTHLALRGFWFHNKFISLDTATQFSPYTTRLALPLSLNFTAVLLWVFLHDDLWIPCSLPISHTAYLSILLADK